MISRRTFRSVKRLTVAAAVVCLGGLAADRLGITELLRSVQRVSTLEREKRELLDFVQRLCATRKVAVVDVLSQEKDSTSRTTTRLRWMDATPKEPTQSAREITVAGKQVFFEGMVIKFRSDLVGHGDSEKGFSLVAFRRAFGDEQTPQSGPPLTLETQDIAQGQWWARFWQMVDDPKMAARYDVRVAQCEAPSVPVSAGQRLEISLDAAGGLNIRKIAPTTTPAAASPR